MGAYEDAFPVKSNGLWYKDAIIYELHVRAFYDSNGDGVGDFPGLTAKLDYLQNLGVTAIWLLPFYPSPLRDDGYDTANYADVHETYGTLRDVKTFVREAHRRGLRVITELVCNHTSDTHPWFQRARRAKPGSAWRDFYVWSDSQENYRDARIIFKDFESSNWTWDTVAGAYYWHRFYSHQPDLNYDNPRVRKAILKAMDFWLQMGIDGLRLDAVPYLFEREGTNCENLPETHTFLKDLRHHVDQRFQNRMLLAEANQWPEDAVAYFGAGNECHMAFHFPLMPRMFMALYMEDRLPIVDILAQTPAIPDNAQWAIFLRNHDELTLEMVTDEERDYMYRVYARDQGARINFGIRRRLAPLLGSHRHRIELMNGLLFSLPGAPVIYYGDEIGMGDNIYLGDRNGVRTPMQWSADRNAGFSRANPQRLYLPVIVDPEYHYESVNVQTQDSNPHSLLWWTKRLIALRKRYKAFGRGTLEFLHPENRKVLAFIRRYREETVLVVANLSRFVQGVELDLSTFRGRVPVEMFGRTPFPPIGELPYFVTLGPHAFYWFSLEQRVAEGATTTRGSDVDLGVPVLAGVWKDAASLLPQEKGESPLADVLPSYLRSHRWFRGKALRIKSSKVVDAIPVSTGAGGAHILLIYVEYAEGEAETYALPLAFAAGGRARQLLEEQPHTVLARFQTGDHGEEGVLYDALVERGFCEALLDVLIGRHRLKGAEGELLSSTTRALRHILATDDERLSASVLKGEHSNTSVVYGDRLILKLFRRIEAGINPDLEIGRLLTEKGFASVPAVAGALEYRVGRDAPVTLAILQKHVPNARDAWQFTLDALGEFLERASASQASALEVPLSARSLLQSAEKDPPLLAREMIDPYLGWARLLGQRTAEMHLELGAGTEDASFAPEPFSSLYQRSIFQSMRVLTVQVFESLRGGVKGLPESVRADAESVLELDQKVLERFRALLNRKISAMRIRCHGDYHLGHVLYTGKDVVIIDFGGEPARPLSERRIKRSPFRDVAGMLRSFHYASHAALLGYGPGLIVRSQDLPSLERWVRFWRFWVSTTFLKAYLVAADRAPFLPQTQEDRQLLLDAFLLEKAIYELGYELNNRPAWLRIPLRGILQLLEVTS